MNQMRMSDFIYTLDLEHVEGHYGVWDFKTFFTRKEAMDFAESLAKNNPDLSVSIGISPRMRKKNILENR